MGDYKYVIRVVTEESFLPVVSFFSYYEKCNKRLISVSIKVRSEITAQVYTDEDLTKKGKHKPKNEKYVSLLLGI